MRLFLALNIPASARQAIHAAAAPLREAAPTEVRWTEAERLHVTLKFLGDQPDDVPARLAEALEARLRGTRPVDLALRRIGAFPTMRRARVVWLGIGPDPRLELLHHDVELACESLGFEVEGRPFRPHLTLGRVRPDAPADLPKRLAAAARTVQYRATERVGSVDVMRSEREAGGSRYSMVHSVMLHHA